MLTACCRCYGQHSWWEGLNACQNLQFLFFYRGKFNTRGLFNSWITPCCLIIVNCWYSTRTDPKYACCALHMPGSHVTDATPPPAPAPAL